MKISHPFQELFKVTGGMGILPVIPVAWASRPRFFLHFEQFLPRKLHCSDFG